MAKVFKQKRVLFFINGPVPTEDDRTEAMSLAGDGFDVAYRNASLVAEGECVEAFDDVAGNVPQAYLDAKAAKERTSVREAFVDSEQTSGKTEKLTPAQKQAAKDKAKQERQAATAAANAAPLVPAADPAAASALAALSGGPAATIGEQGTLAGTTAAPAPAAPAAPWKPNA